MDSIHIQGPTRLVGEVKISGAKNSSLPIMAATILASSGESVIHNVPRVSDVLSMIKILKSLGAKVRFEGNTLCINASTVKVNRADYQHVSTMRASICLLGPLLARFRQAWVSLPGGCVIGARPIDLHLKGLRHLGANVELEHGYVKVEAKDLRGGHMYLGGAYGSSVLATANVMMVACLSKGKTQIVNAACEPEIIDLGNFLNKMGAKIEGLGSPLLSINGVKKLRACEHAVIPDRIEAGTYLLAGAITKGDIALKNAPSQFLGALLDNLHHWGMVFTEKNNSLRFKVKSKPKAVSVTTFAYPGFPTDLQAQMTALLTLTPGISVVTEKIFPERFMHISELSRMGAQIRLEGPSAIIEGAKKLSGAPVMASDLRASAALVLAGLAAQGSTEISRVYHLDRGYENMVQKFQALGANIKRVSNNAQIVLPTAYEAYQKQR